MPYAFLVYTRMVTPTERAIGGVVPWLCSQTDMFANDWHEIVVQQAPAPVPGPAPEDDQED